MSHKHMARGSKVAATLPAITAFAGKVRPAAISSDLPVRVRSHHSPRAGAMIRKALEAMNVTDSRSGHTISA